MVRADSAGDGSTWFNEASFDLKTAPCAAIWTGRRMFFTAVYGFVHTHARN